MIKETSNPVVVTCGLDMSLTASGFCLKQGSDIQSTTIKTTPKTKPNDIERLQHIVDETIKRIPQDVSLIVIEDFFTPHNSAQIKAALGLVGLGTLMRNAMYKAGFPFFVAAPTQLKKFLTGKGNAQKSSIIMEVYKRWGIECPDDNQADATVLAYMAELIHALHTGQRTDHFPGYQIEVAKKVLNERANYNLK